MSEASMKCQHCGEEIVEGQYATEGDQSWHADCYNTTHLCSVCGKPIPGQRSEARGKIYHPSCFKCRQCGKILVDQFVEVGGSVYCSQQCSKVKSTTAPAPATAPAQPKSEMASGGAHCVECGKSTKGHGVFEVPEAGLVYHAECFRCCSCGKQITDNTFTLGGVGSVLGVSPTCMDCTNSTAPRCAACSRPILATALTAPDGSQYHEECLRCAKCNAVLRSSFVEMKDKRKLCQACARTPAPPPLPPRVSRQLTKCPSCSATLKASGKFCSACGANLH